MSTGSLKDITEQLDLGLQEVEELWEQIADRFDFDEAIGQLNQAAIKLMVATDESIGPLSESVALLAHLGNRLSDIAFALEARTETIAEVWRSVTAVKTGVAARLETASLQLAQLLGRDTSSSAEDQPAAEPEPSGAGDRSSTGSIVDLFLELIERLSDPEGPNSPGVETLFTVHQDNHDFVRVGRLAQSLVRARLQRK